MRVMVLTVLLVAACGDNGVGVNDLATRTDLARRDAGADLAQPRDLGTIDLPRYDLAPYTYDLQPPADLTPLSGTGCLSEPCNTGKPCKAELECVNGSCARRACNATSNPCPALGMVCLNFTCQVDAGASCDLCSKVCYSGSVCGTNGKCQ